MPFGDIKSDNRQKLKNIFEGVLLTCYYHIFRSFLETMIIIPNE